MPSAFAMYVCQTVVSSEDIVKYRRFFSKKSGKHLVVLKKSVPLQRFKKAIDCFT